MSRTGAQLLTAFSRFIGDEIEPAGLTTSSAGASDGTTLIDTDLRQLGEDSIKDFYLRPTGSTNQYEIRRITDFAESNGTCTVAPAFSAQAANAQAYELHRYHPAQKFQALDEARKSVYPDVAQVIYNDTVTADGRSDAFDIPSSIRRGPVAVFMEQPVSADASWNFLQDPQGDSTSNFTASNFTATTYARTDSDLLIPKYDSTATELVLGASTAGTYRQVVGSMVNDITASIAAGRRMTAAAWVYSRAASKIAIEFLDDSGQVAASSQHGGNGWELLTATGNVIATNATTLTWGLTADNDSTPLDAFWNHGWFYLGEADRVRSVYGTLISKRNRRDDTTQKVYTDSIPARGRQLRMIGRDVLSALGTTAATQVTNTMEVDEEGEQVLLAEAARVLFRWHGLNADDLPEVAHRLQIADGLRRQLRTAWRYNLPGTPTLKNPWS